MKLEIDESALPVFSALDSPVRIKIIQLLAKKKMNIKEIAKELNLSNSIITMHISKLEDAKLIKTERVPGKSGLQKLSSLKVQHIGIDFPVKFEQTFDYHDVEIPVGQFTNYEVFPSCGMASIKDFIGHLDEPKYFMNPNRFEAQIIWFTKGFLEYKTTNYLNPNEDIQLIELSMEISSEFPFSNDDWPSDITFSLNDIEVGTWTSPGDYSDIRGKNNPEWWPENMNQYGILKTLQITKHGTYMNGEKLSNISIDKFKDAIDYWTIKFEIKESAENVGGLTIFGRGFGDYEQEIKLRVYFN